MDAWKHSCSRSGHECNDFEIRPPRKTAHCLCRRNRLAIFKTAENAPRPATASDPIARTFFRPLRGYEVRQKLGGRDSPKNQGNIVAAINDRQNARAL